MNNFKQTIAFSNRDLNFSSLSPDTPEMISVAATLIIGISNSYKNMNRKRIDDSIVATSNMFIRKSSKPINMSYEHKIQHLY